jgi:hypothetical protein
MQQVVAANESIASSVDEYGGHGTPNFCSYHRRTRASLRTSTSAGTSAKATFADWITASSASQDRSVASK